MAWKEKRIRKRYYTIGVIARFLRESQSAIRFWQKEFHIETKRRKAKNIKSQYRLYTREDLAKLIEVHYLLRVEKYTLAGAKSKFEGYDH